jgi:hypothetical protein
VDARADERESWVATPPRSVAATWALRAMMWGALCCGPLALLAALDTPATGPSVHAPGTATASPIGPAGFAELYVQAYLRSGADDPAVKSFYPQAPALTAPSGQRNATSTETTAARQVSPGYWAITVAADVSARNAKGTLTPTGVHFFSVPVIVVGGASASGSALADSAVSYIAAALPAEVAGPAQATAPSLGYTDSQQVATGPLADTVHAFAAAYLTGTGELGRYLSPGTQLQPISPPPYTGIDVTSITAAAALPGDATTVPGDGTRVRLLVGVDAIDGSGQRWPLTYALTAAARAGRWEIAGLDPAPALSPASRPTAVTPTLAVPTDSSGAGSAGAPSPAPPTRSTPASPAP